MSNIYKEDDNIYAMLCENYKISEICKKLGCTREVVARVKKFGIEYIDLSNGKIFYRGKKRDEKLDNFIILYQYFLNHGLESGNKVIDKKSRLIEIASFCEVHKDKAYRNKENVIVSLESFKMSKVIIDYFYENRQDKFISNFYDLDAEFIKGTQLYYHNYCTFDNFSYYIHIKVKNFLNKGNVTKYIHDPEKGFTEHLCHLIAEQLFYYYDRIIKNGEDKEEILRYLRSFDLYLKEDYTLSKEKEDLFTPPSIIYYRTDGFQLLPIKGKLKIITQLENGKILGGFSYDAMELKIEELKENLKEVQKKKGK